MNTYDNKIIQHYIIIRLFQKFKFNLILDIRGNPLSSEFAPFMNSICCKEIMKYLSDQYLSKHKNRSHYNKLC